MSAVSIQGRKVKDNPQHNLCHQTNGAFQRDRTLKIQVRQRTLEGTQFMLILEATEAYLRLECPEGKLRKPSRNIATSVWVHIVEFDN